MVAQLMRAGGLHLGREEDLIPGNASNPDGHWEHIRVVEVNDALLQEFGGGWDSPPDLSGLRDRARTTRIARQAASVLEEFEGCQNWGWKDPRNSLTLPFGRE